jgi:hypothetical protein
LLPLFVLHPFISLSVLRVASELVSPSFFVREFRGTDDDYFVVISSCRCHSLSQALARKGGGECRYTGAVIP